MTFSCDINDVTISHRLVNRGLLKVHAFRSTLSFAATPLETPAMLG
jgi:hypothetical protein